MATGVNLIVLVQSLFKGGQASVLSRRVSLIAGTREKEEKKDLKKREM